MAQVLLGFCVSRSYHFSPSLYFIYKKEWFALIGDVFTLELLDWFWNYMFYCFGIIHTHTHTHLIIYLFLKVYLFIMCKYTVGVFRHPRRGHQISLRMVVSHHVVARDLNS